MGGTGMDKLGSLKMMIENSTHKHVIAIIDSKEHEPSILNKEFSTEEILFLNSLCKDNVETLKRALERPMENKVTVIIDNTHPETKTFEIKNYYIPERNYELDNLNIKKKGKGKGKKNKNKYYGQ